MPRILIVDDDESLLRSLRRQLGRRYDVTTASSARAALEIIEREPFDAVLCDLQMPDVNGLDVYLHLQKHHPDVADRVIFMTGAFGSPLERIVRGTNNPRIGKPVDVAELAELVRNVAPTTPPPRAD